MHRAVLDGIENLVRVLLVCFLHLSFVQALMGGASDLELVVLNDDGAWSWFEDERAIIVGRWLLAGSVAAGGQDVTRQGAVEIVAYNLESRQSQRLALSYSLEYDDHNSPALLEIGGGRILAAYSKHGSDNRVHLWQGRVQEENGLVGEEDTVFIPSEASRVTYANLYRLSRENGGKGRIYDFFRGLDNSFKPSFIFSDDHGQTWQVGNVVISVPSEFKHRPYVKYQSNGTDTIHLTYTEGHPRDFNNSVYHVYYRDGNLHRTNGSVIHMISQGLCSPGEGTRIFPGNPDNVAWVSDIELDPAGHPCVVYSVQRNSSGLPVGQGGNDIRYRYARWNGSAWEDHEIGFGGSRLYAGEDDYSGNLALDPNDVRIVYTSTNVDPESGVALASGHYEIFRGVTRNRGQSWRWIPVTKESDCDNIRPIVPDSDGAFSVVLWLRGTYRSYTDYDLQVVGLVSGAGKRIGEETPSN